MRTGRVSPIPEHNLVILRWHGSFAVCYQASALSNCLRHSCYQTSISLRYQLSRPTQRQPYILPLGGANRRSCPLLPPLLVLPWGSLDMTTCQVSPAFDRLCLQLSLSRQITLIWIFFFSFDLAPRTCTFDKRVNGAYVACEFRNAVLHLFSFSNSHFNQVLRIPVHMNVWPHNDSFFNGTSSLEC